MHHVHLHGAGRWQFFGHCSCNVACYLPPTPGYGFSIILKQPPSFCYSNTSGALNIPALAACTSLAAPRPTRRVIIVVSRHYVRLLPRRSENLPGEQSCCPESAGCSRNDDDSVSTDARRCRFTGGVLKFQQARRTVGGGGGGGTNREL